MNENTAKLLEKLAHKLGTTSEYLWQVLLKQAPINSFICLIQFCVVIVFGVVLYKVHKRLLKKQKNGNDRYEESLYEQYDIAAALPMGIGAIMFAILFIVCVMDIQNIINGLFNPEYWALEKVLSTIK